MSGCGTSTLSAAFWNALFRPMWGIGIGFLVYLCDLGYGLVLNDLLSCNLFHIIARPTYCFYIFHYMVVVLWNECLKSQIYIDPITIAVHFSGLFVIVMAMSIILYLFFEIP